MIDFSQFVEEGSTVFTDELNSYNRLADMGYNHKICNHGQLQYVVDGETYTNNIEGICSHILMRLYIVGIQEKRPNRNALKICSKSPLD